VIDLNLRTGCKLLPARDVGSRLKLRTSWIAVNEDEKHAVPISVVALRAESYSADGVSIVISLRTKYSTAERRYSVPVECFRDLIVDLHRLNAAKAGDRVNKTGDEAEPCLPLGIPIAAE
jgi:hypothetical protein